MSPAFFRSIRWHVQAWHGAILLIVIAAFCVLALRVAWSNRLRQVDAEIRVALRDAMFAIAHEGEEPAEQSSPPKFDPARIEQVAGRLRRGEFVPPPALIARFSSTAPGHDFLIVHDREGRILYRTPNTPLRYEFKPRLRPGMDDEFRITNDYREFSWMLPEEIGMVYARDIRPDRDGARRFAWTLAASSFALWVAGLLGGSWLAGRAIKPIEHISTAATRIAEGDLDERIPTKGMANELHQLSVVLNNTFERLRATFDRQKRFTADASHELRTPLAIMLSETQRVLKKERSAGEYQESLRACREAAVRMNRLTEDLLLLAGHEGAAPLRVQDADLATIAADALAQLSPIATARAIVIESELSPAPFRGDAATLGIVLTNLIRNAIQHHDKANGRVAVKTYVTTAGSVCTVADDGPGIPAESLPHIFERFYRVDRARTASEHSGLGLAIARTLTEQHGGSLTVDTPATGGSTFTITLPKKTEP